MECWTRTHPDVLRRVHEAVCGESKVQDRASHRAVLGSSGQHRCRVGDLLPGRAKANYNATEDTGERSGLPVEHM
jgi:hypothetical protein